MQLDHAVVAQLRMHHALFVGEVHTQVVLQFVLKDLLLYRLLKNRTLCQFCPISQNYELQDASKEGVKRLRIFIEMI